LYRAIYSYYHGFNIYRNVFNSHIRFDSLFLGVILSYFYRYKKNTTVKFFTDNRYVLWPVALALACQPFFIELFDLYMYTAGFSLISLGFGMILLLLLSNPESPFYSRVKNVAPLKWITFVGYYSYTVYLWHIPAEALISKYNLYYTVPTFPLFCIYLCSCVGIGFVFAKLVEIPMLKIRERYFPVN
jgi:peptidoglycan/LPS O-acetylase OafA/YrhL